MEDLQLCDDDTVLLGCKILIEERRQISVGKTIVRYFRLKYDEKLTMKIHAQLLESKKYVASTKIDKYGYPYVQYSNLNYFERNATVKEVILMLISAIVGVIVGLLVK